MTDLGKGNKKGDKVHGSKKTVQDFRPEKPVLSIPSLKANAPKGDHIVKNAKERLLEQ